MNDRRWRLAPLVELDWREVDGQWLAFDNGSGDTHLLGNLPALVLTCLESEPDAVTDADLRENLVATLGAADTSPFELLPQVLTELQTLGLITDRR